MGVGSGDNPIGGGPIGGGPIGPWPDDDGGATLYFQTITANVLCAAALVRQTNKLVVPTATCASNFTRRTSATRTIHASAALTVVKAVSTTLTSALASGIATMTRRAGKVVGPSVLASVTRGAFVVGKLILPGVDAAVSVTKAVTFRVTNALCGVANITRKLVSYTFANIAATVAASFIKQARLISSPGVIITVTYTIGAVVNVSIAATVTCAAAFVKQVNKLITANSTIAALVSTFRATFRRVYNALYY